MTTRERLLREADLCDRESAEERDDPDGNALMVAYWRGRAESLRLKAFGKTKTLKRTCQPGLDVG